MPLFLLHLLNWFRVFCLFVSFFIGKIKKFVRLKVKASYCIANGMIIEHSLT